MILFAPNNNDQSFNNDETDPDALEGFVDQVEAMFSDQGLFAAAKNFEYRPQQQRMAVEIARSLIREDHLLVEAGTGVGKSLAYLVPSILYARATGKKAIISTNTINLQEQLIGKDLPMLKARMGVDFQFAMLKGRRNYVCKRRLQRALQQADSLFTSPELEELKRIQAWAEETEDGSLSDLSPEPDYQVWSQVCSERGLCAPKLCGHSSDFAKTHGPCFFQQVRAQLMAADLVVLNHTLFFSLLGSLDKAPEDGILFKKDFVIFDEAHTLERVASRHIGVSVSSAQIKFALHRLWNPRTQKGLLSQLRKGASVELTQRTLESTDEFFDEAVKQCDQLAAADNNKKPAYNRTQDADDEPEPWRELKLKEPLKLSTELTDRIQQLRENLRDMIQSSEDRETCEELQDCASRLFDIKSDLGLLAEQPYDDHVYWVERSSTGAAISFHAAPIFLAPYLKKILFGSRTSVVLASATLSTVGEISKSAKLKSASAPRSESDESTEVKPHVPDPTEWMRREAGKSGLSYVARRVGAEACDAIQLGSPFNYSQQMKVIVDSSMPDPRANGFRNAMAAALKKYIQQTEGRALVLFTNYKLMREMAEELASHFQTHGWTLYTQSSRTPRTLLMEQFKADTHSVLFGTESFWQGVDAPGETLSNVIITRLPFSVPDHPVVSSQIEWIESRGGNAFMDYTIPEAILKFRQGIGRLIRTASDSGIVVLLDPRVIQKRYGRMFLDALPDCEVEVFKG